MAHIYFCLSKQKPNTDILRLLLLHQINLSDCFPPFYSVVNRKSVSEFLNYPTRLFVLTEMAFIIESLPHHKEFMKALPRLLQPHILELLPHSTGSIKTCAGSFSHPILKASPGIKLASCTCRSKYATFVCCFVEPLPFGVPVLTDPSAAFISVLYYSLQEIFRNLSPEFYVSIQFIEKCLILFCIQRVPPTTALKSYMHELILFLINIISGENEVLGGKSIKCNNKYFHTF